ncbi:MAG: hypothetical protein AABX00_00515 [Nanoarchaeota archaeon]
MDKNPNYIKKIFFWSGGIMFLISLAIGQSYSSIVDPPPPFLSLVLFSLAIGALGGFVAIFLSESVIWIYRKLK